MKPQFLIDTDTASDDAVALIMALRSPRVRVIAITTVAGNVAVQQATRNALYTAELCGSDVPVFMGAEEPLNRPHQSAHWFHGRDGLGDHGYPPPRKAPEKLPALEAIITMVESHPGLVLVTLGPLTNLALALQLNPGIAAKVSRCVIMGGAPCCEGNVTPAAEYNIWCDPEAARVVLHSGLPIELVGWHLCRGDAALNPEDIKYVLSFGTPQARSASLSRTDRRTWNFVAGPRGDVHRAGPVHRHPTNRELRGRRDLQRTHFGYDRGGSPQRGWQ